jgi:EpsI family protein
MRRLLVTIALLGTTALYVWAHPPVNLALGRGVLSAVPVAFGPWNGTDLSFEDAVIEELQPDDLLIRRYERGREVVWLCLVYHQNRRYGAHDPRVCYESQGWLIDRESEATVDDGTSHRLEVRRFVADRPTQKRLVYYWWTTKGLATPDRDAFRSRMALLGAMDNRSWGAFVRVETPIPHGDVAAAERRLQDFAAAVARALPGVLSAGDRATAVSP